jgi:O-antigen/teichoic acid export membrane protein
VFRIILIGTFLSLICVPAFYTLLGLGKARYCFFSSAIQGIINAAIIVTIVLVRGKISVNSIALSVMIAMGITSCYLLWQKRCVMKGKLLEIRNNNIADSFEDITGSCGN